MRFFITLAAIWGLSGAAGADVSGTFELTREAERRWKASFCFGESVSALGFERPVADFRAASWAAGEPGFELIHTGRTSLIQRADKAPFNCASVTLTTNTMIPPKDYMPFSSFSDGGASVFTGYLMGQVYRNGVWESYDLRASYRGLEGDRVVTRNPKALAEQFVYFGPREPKEIAGATLVIDPLIPASARLGVLSTLPRGTKLLAELFGFRPAEPYLVFLAAGELETSATDQTKAGTLPYQILFTMKGKGSARWADSDPLYFPRFTMHEVLHIWQREVWGEWLGDDHPWVHEGAAEALAYELMNQAGAYNAAELTSLWATVRNKCRNLLAETSVHDAPEKGRFDTVYQCGALINRMVGEALNPDAPGGGMIRFWQEMAKWDASQKGVLTSEQLYLNTMARLGFGEGARTALSTFLKEKPASPDAALKALKHALTL
ncbi:hypothetical protein [Kordiimonas lacus]|uniref:Peptidase MA superfamily protein n=1 Tax=Kordiimonas lacus TaxID=637679 RepID=A0A1G7F168_9PROT|nr:hypothetical protein [Kordiimonas lacus]SDE69345.1 hypothetical protein SAMN04488071_3562 [Kordiimonas lacus]